MREIDTFIRNASAHELEQWSKKPKTGEIRHWRHSPHPLYRAAELGRIDLMQKWVDWGCSMRGTHGTYLNPMGDPCDTRSIVAILFEKNSNLITLVGDHSPHLLEDILKDVIHYDLKQLDRSDLFRGLTQMRTQKIDTTELVSDMIVASIATGFGPLQRLLEFNAGVIAPSSNWKYKFNSIGSGWSSRQVKDSEAYKRVNALPSEVISSVDATAFLELGLAVTIYSLKMHLEIMDRSTKFVVSRKKTNWEKLQSSFHNEWRPWSFTEDAWTDVFESLLDNVVDVRSTGSGLSRSTVFSFIRSVSLPENVLTLLAVRAWEASPHLMHLPVEKTIGVNASKKTRSFIEATERSSGALLNIRSTLMSLESHDRLKRVVQTQTKKIKGPVVVHRRKM